MKKERSIISWITPNIQWPSNQLNDGIPIAEDALSNECKAIYSCERTNKDTILEKINTLLREELHQVCYYLMSYHCYGMNKDVVFKLLQLKVSQREMRDLMGKMVFKYQSHLLNEFIPKKSKEEVLGDCLEVFVKLQEMQKKTAEDLEVIRQRQEKIRQEQTEIRQGFAEIRQEQKRIGQELTEALGNFCEFEAELHEFKRECQSKGYIETTGDLSVNNEKPSAILEDFQTEKFSELSLS